MVPQQESNLYLTLRRQSIVFFKSLILNVYFYFMADLGEGLGLPMYLAPLWQ